MRGGTPCQAGPHVLGQGPRDGDELLLLWHRQVGEPLGDFGLVVLPADLLSLESGARKRDQGAATIGQTKPLSLQADVNGTATSVTISTEVEIDRSCGVCRGRRWVLDSRIESPSIRTPSRSSSLNPT
jgi:hypothetical protein